MAEEELKYELLAIGGSAGGLEGILAIIPALPADFRLAVLIILHSRSDSLLAELISGRTTLPVKEVEEKEPILPGNIYIAPGDYHVLIEPDKTFSLDFSEKVNYSRPSIDVSFESAAEVYSSKMIGVLLSGANADGTEGLRAIKQLGGLTVVQNPGSATVSYMPQQAIENVQIDNILDIPGIIQLIHDLT